MKYVFNPTKNAAQLFTLAQYKDPGLIFIDYLAIEWNKNDDSVRYLGVLRRKTDMKNALKKITHPRLCQNERTLFPSKL